MKIKAYMCGTDWFKELPDAQDVKIYTSLKKFKKDRQCYEECGIIEVEIVKKRIVKKGTL